MQGTQPQRIQIVDVLRGYALMGLFLIHMVEYFELYWANPVPSDVNSTMFFLFGGKAYAMFALLFGVSFYIIMESQGQKGVDFRARFLWRLAVLLAIGYVHSLIYGGDILQVLAITGLILVPAYRLGNAALLSVALFFVLQVPALVLHALGDAGSSDSTGHSLLMQAYAHGTFMDVVLVNAWYGQVGKWSFMLDSGRLWNIVGLSLLGFLLARIGFFTEPERYKSIYVKAFVAMLGLATVLVSFQADLIAWVPEGDSRSVASSVVGSYTNISLMFVTLLGLVLLYRLEPVARVLRLLAPCGRMSLTIYVSQAVICIPFFYGFGVGAYAFIGQPLSAALGVVLWCGQVWLAHTWFKRYYYGPLEWLWRSATWLRSDIPFRRIADARSPALST